MATHRHRTSFCNMGTANSRNQNSSDVEASIEIVSGYSHGSAVDNRSEYSTSCGLHTPKRRPTR